jgi:glutathione S-transferase
VFADMGQCSKEDLDLFDFAPYPNLSAWIARMKTLPGYAETHNDVMEGMKAIIQQAKEKKAKANL